MGGQNYFEEFEEYLKQDDHLGRMIWKKVAKYGDDKIAVRHKPHGEWIAYTWKQFGELIENTALGLLSLNLKEQELIGIFAHNCVEWIVADAAGFYCRAASVPVYATNSAKELEYLVNHAEIRILFVGDQVQYEKALSIRNTAPTLEWIIVLDGTVAIKPDPKVMYLSDLMEMGKRSGKDQELKERVQRLDTNDLCTVIYTSGTTGVPKGVPLTHFNFYAMGFETGYHLPVNDQDVSLAFLPLSHIFERGWTYFMLNAGGQVDFCHDTKALLEFLKETRPTYMTSVPRLWEKVYAQVKEGVANSSPVKQKFFNWALEVGGDYQWRRHDGRPIPVGLRIKHRIADRLVLRKIRDIFGGRAKMFNVGGAPFSPEIAEFFFKAGVLLLMGYGQTECFVICVANPKKIKFKTCGPVCPLVDVKISPEGEILAKSPSMMKGYFKQPELTREVFTEEGYIKTGDVGFIDEEGYITITDRIKDLMKTSGGKYIAPTQIETLLIEDYYIEQAVAIGEGRKYVSALIVPSFTALEEYARKNGIVFNSREDLVRNPRIIEFYRQRIDEATKDLGQVEKVKKFTLLPNEFTQEAGELTPTQKIKRKVINERYRDLIEAMYT